MFDHKPFQLYNAAYLICRRPAEIFFAKFQIFRDVFHRTAILFWVNVYIASYADRVFIFGSNDAICVQIGAGIQEIWHNMLHHPTEKVPKSAVFGSPCGVSGARSLPLKHVKISHR